MQSRLASIILILMSCIVSLPLGNQAVAKPQSNQRDQVMMEQAIEDGNPSTDEFSGGSWSEGQYVALNSYSVHSDTYYAPTAEGGWEERVDFVYSDSNLNRADGSSLVEANYELDRPYNHSDLYMTINGVTITFDLVNENAYFLSDADEVSLQAWSMSQEARVVENTTTSLIEQGYQQLEPGLLLGI